LSTSGGRRSRQRSEYRAGGFVFRSTTGLSSPRPCNIMAAESLLGCYRRFLAETAWLLTAFDAGLAGLGSAHALGELHRLSGEMAVVRLHDAWGRFCRELIISSAGCRPFTASGVRLVCPPGIRGRPDVIPFLLNSYNKPRTYEPKWAVSHDCLDAAQRIGIANFATVTAAIGSTNSPVEDLRRVRNFFAHRGKWSADEVRSRFSFPVGSPLTLEALAGQLVPPGITRMESWVNGLRTVAGAAIQ